MAIPVCGFEFDGLVCKERGPHRCVPRGDKVSLFFPQVLVHPKGVMQGQPFELEDWQEDEIIRPLFETVDYSQFARSYARTYRQAWLELARKSGKSTLVAGMVLYMLMADGELGGENYIGARDRNQASIIFNTASQMVELSPVLSKKCKVLAAGKRIVHEDSRSFLQVISSDAMSALGFNPHGSALDEIVAHPNGMLWDAMDTATGARKQPLLIAATTAGTDITTFAGNMHKEMERIQEDPTRAPHVFVYMRNTPMKADPWNEDNWYHANPGLGRYLDIQELRNQSLAAQNDPSREITFRTFRLNQWTQVSTRWMPSQTWDASQGELWTKPDFGRTVLEGSSAFGAFDLSSTNDMTAWCLVVPNQEHGTVDVMWRFWLPQDAVDRLDEKTDGQISKWVSEGWITTNEGNTVDYDNVYEGIVKDIRDFDIREIDYDPYTAEAVVQRIEQLSGKNTPFIKVQQTFAQMSPALTSVMTAVQGQRFLHHGNPVARWNFESTEVKFATENPDLIRPVKPERGKDSKRIDGAVAAAMAMGAYTLRGEDLLKPRGRKGTSKGRRAFAW